MSNSNDNSNSNSNAPEINEKPPREIDVSDYVSVTESEDPEFRENRLKNK